MLGTRAKGDRTKANMIQTRKREHSLCANVEDLFVRIISGIRVKSRRRNLVRVVVIHMRWRVPNNTYVVHVIPVKINPKHSTKIVASSILEVPL